MHIVKQLPKACLVACLESFLADRGIVRGQQELIDVLLQAGLSSPQGAVDRGAETLGCSLLGIRFSDVKYEFPIPQQYLDGSLLIGTSLPSRHLVRYDWQPLSTKIVVMDPEVGQLMWWDQSKLEPQDPAFHTVEVIDAGLASGEKRLPTSKAV